MGSFRTSKSPLIPCAATDAGMRLGRATSDKCVCRARSGEGRRTTASAAIQTAEMSEHSKAYPDLLERQRDFADKICAESFLAFKSNVIRFLGPKNVFSRIA